VLVGVRRGRDEEADGVLSAEARGCGGAMGGRDMLVLVTVLHSDRSCCLNVVDVGDL